ncbi:hypothetical protein HNP84_005593 [Thermocatellispora tengchongensis]|uniref:Uncharacterized protein n=1 Tax=Thermocatellispora tengchongensis TaxID=1073253 RepID=A0A840PA16_9ACTN|nr:hypothetical protein [Thermocatellispora tengchongensis]
MCGGGPGSGVGRWLWCAAGQWADHVDGPRPAGQHLHASRRPTAGGAGLTVQGEQDGETCHLGARGRGRRQGEGRDVLSGIAGERDREATPSAGAAVTARPASSAQRGEHTADRAHETTPANPSRSCPHPGRSRPHPRSLALAFVPAPRPLALAFVPAPPARPGPVARARRRAGVSGRRWILRPTGWGWMPELAETRRPPAASSRTVTHPVGRVTVPVGPRLVRPALGPARVGCPSSPSRVLRLAWLCRACRPLGSCPCSTGPRRRARARSGIAARSPPGRLRCLSSCPRRSSLPRWSARAGRPRPSACPAPGLAPPRVPAVGFVPALGPAPASRSCPVGIAARSPEGRWRCLSSCPCRSLLLRWSGSGGRPEAAVARSRRVLSRSCPCCGGLPPGMPLGWRGAGLGRGGVVAGACAEVGSGGGRAGWGVWDGVVGGLWGRVGGMGRHCL